MKYELNGYFAHWCPHCIQFLPTWNKLITKLSKDIKVNTYYDGENNDIISSNNISGFPTIQFKKDNYTYEINRSNNIIDMENQINDIINNRTKNHIEKFADMSADKQFDTFNNFLNANNINIMSGGANKNTYNPAYSLNGGNDTYLSNNTTYLEDPIEFYKEKYIKYKTKYLNLKNSLNK